MTEETNEALSLAQRLKKGRELRRRRSKLKRARARSNRRIANQDTLKRRARRSAIKQVKKKMAGGKDPSKLSFQRRQSIEKRLKTRKGVVDRLARKGIKTARKQDRDRKKTRREEFESLNAKNVSEGENVKKERDDQKREREALKRRHDRELDRARTQDTQKKNRATEALEEKAEKANFPKDVIFEVYERGLDDYDNRENISLSPQQYAFARVNSFIHGGAARKMDSDLLDEKFDLENPDQPWNTKTNKRIIKVKKDGQTAKPVGDSAEKRMFQSLTGFTQVPLVKLKGDMRAIERQGYKIVMEGAGEWGTDELRKTYAEDTPGQPTDVQDMYSADKPQIEDTYKNQIQERRDFLKKIQSRVHRLSRPKQFEKALEIFRDIESAGPKRKTKSAIASIAARQTGLGPKEFMDWIEDQTKLGRLPKNILSEYDPTEDK